MPFTNRNRQRLSDRMRGRSGEELLNELKSSLNTDRNMFFDTPGWTNTGRSSTFARDFPFDDEDFVGLRGRRSRPSFTDTAASSGFGEALHEPPLDEDLRRKRPREPPQPQQPEQQHLPPHGLNQHGLRNTVPLGKGARGEEVGRPARAMSAPPTADRSHSEQPRFVSSCEIPLTDPQQQQNPQQQSQPSNVRLIPIQVEGRDEPLVNVNVDSATSFPHETAAPQFEGRLPRDFGPFRKCSSRFQPPQAPSPFQPQQSPSPFQPQQSPSPQQKQPAAPSPAAQRPPPSNQKHTDETDSHAPPPPRQPQPPPDPAAIALAQVASVQKEVEDLAVKVAEATPTSRADKQYVYLDEMLTRQLLRLDNIDPNGLDNVRNARKEAIRSIQNCISVLESKVPQEPMEVDQSQDIESQPEPMGESQEAPPPTNSVPPPVDGVQKTNDSPA